jgi:chromosome segregation ATPase
MSTLLEIADELYGLTLPEFTPARDARAKELKASDKELSAQVKALKKPSVAAWVVNALVRHETEQVDQVLAVGEALREAQAGMSGEELRALTKQRRQLTAAVTTQARRLAAELGTKVTQAVADTVEATLTAAMIDEGCAQAVRSGQLLTALSATGVDEVDLAAAVATPEALGFAATPRSAEAEPEQRPDLHVVPDPEADRKAVQEAEKALAAADKELAKATKAHDAAKGDVSELEARSMQVQAELDELRSKLADLESRLEEVEEELSDAEDVRSEAEDAQATAQEERDAAAAVLKKLKG